MRSKFRNRRSAVRGGDDDLVDVFFGANDKPAASPAADRRLKQLCREVFRVLSQSVPNLDGVSVADVRPAPDASRLAVVLHLEGLANPEEIIARLHKMKGALRAEIAAAIQRKRTPELVFEVGP